VAQDAHGTGRFGLASWQCLSSGLTAHAVDQSLLPTAKRRRQEVVMLSNSTLAVAHGTVSFPVPASQTTFGRVLRGLAGNGWDMATAASVRRSPCTRIPRATVCTKKIAEWSDNGDVCHAWSDFSLSQALRVGAITRYFYSSGHSERPQHRAAHASRYGFQGADITPFEHVRSWGAGRPLRRKTRRHMDFYVQVPRQVLC